MTALRCMLALVTAALVAGGCGSGDDAASPARSVTVVLDWTPNTNHSGVYLAKARGFYDDAGLRVDIIEPDQSGGLSQVTAGNADIAFTYAEQLLPARAEGAPVVSVATVLRTNTSSLVAPADRGIRRPRDLEGATYGTYGGPIERPLIEALVRCDGGDPAKVQFVEVGNGDYAAGFARNLYDVVWAFDGWDVIRLRDIAKVPVTTLALRDRPECIPDWYTPILATSDERLRNDPALIRDFLAATAAGYRAAAEDPQAGADALIDAVPETDRALVGASARFLAPFTLDDDGRWGVQDPAVWERFSRFLTDAAIIAPVSDVDALFTNDLLPR